MGTPPVPAPPVAASPSVYVKPISPGQKSYINDLGGHWEVDWSYDRASEEIVRLKGGGGRPTSSHVSQDPRLKIIENMLQMIPDGYYATAPDGVGGHVDFLKLARPQRGRFKGCIKISTQHSERWQERIIGWPSGQWSVYQQNVIDMVLLVIADYHSCARRYAIEKQACCVCNTALTDDRSRHYLIGPDCEKKERWAHVLEEVDNINMGLSFEDLVSRGLPTRVWQEKHLAGL
jgi:hypothetical protein